MKKSQLNYPLEEKFIATEPVHPQHNSKLLVLDRNTGQLKHKHFYDLPHILNANDVLVFNQTKVLKANIIGKKVTGGKVEVLLTKQVSEKPLIWQCIGKNIPYIDQKIIFSNDIFAIVKNKKSKYVNLEFSVSRVKFNQFLESNGQMPIPPYIHKKRLHQIDSKTSYNDETDYQTSYAKSLGSVAAPTAGLHFTETLLADLKKSGIQSQFVTLHVGLGTFEPIKNDDLIKHEMHSEQFTLPEDVAQYLNSKKKQGSRIIAVGTTTVRVLESCADETGTLIPRSGDTDIFIYPPYQYKFVDGLITNFHLPESTLLALVSAFVSKPNTKHDFKDFESSITGKAYSEAKNSDYRFYSYGDGMLIT